MNMFTPAETTENYACSALQKTKMPIPKLLALSFLAGMAIALAGLATCTGASLSDNPATQRMISSVFFPVGLFIVLLTGSELFTGNMLLSISVFDRRTPLLRMLRNWLVVYIGNFLGSMTLVLSCTLGGKTGAMSQTLAAYLVKVAAAKCALPFGPALTLGIYCNVLVCLGVFMGSCAKDSGGKVLGAFGPVALFIMCGFEHCVANMFYIPAGLMLAGRLGEIPASLSWGNFLFGNMVPVTLGNIIGGVAFGGVLWLGYLRTSKKEKLPQAGGRMR